MADERVDYAGLFEHVAGVRLVLFGTAPHQAWAFQRDRATISQRLWRMVRTP